MIVGDSAIGEVAYEYFTYDSEYEVVAFSVESAYLKNENKFGLPVVAFESVEKRFAPEEHAIFVAVGFAKMNRVRARLFREAKAKGYLLASYISSKAFVWHNVTIGENAFILENNVLQPFSTIGDDVVLWSGNHIGHHVKIGSHVFISSQVVLSGFVEIGDHCFVGVNAAVSQGVKIERDCLVGAGANIQRNTDARAIYAVEGTKKRPVDALVYSGVKENE